MPAPDRARTTYVVSRCTRRFRLAQLDYWNRYPDKVSRQNPILALEQGMFRLDVQFQ